MSNPRLAAVIVLAAGEGTRMKSATPKVLHRIAGRTLVGHAIAAAREAEPEHLAVVVRHERDLVATHVAEVDPKAVIADQDDVKGTGRAVQCALDVLPADLDGTVLVTYGDVPLLAGSTLHALVDHHSASGSAVTVITANLANPTGYGRILRGADDSVEGIVEHKDATPDQLAITEINSGIYAFDAQVLRDALEHVTTDNSQGEKYLTDVLAIARAAGGRVAAHLIDDLWQTEGVNDRVQLARLGKELNRRITEKWMREGVTIVDPETTWIDADVAIGRDATILPGTQLLGATTIGADAVIGRTAPSRTPRWASGRRSRAPRAGSRWSGPTPRSGRSPICDRHRARCQGQDRRLRRDQERQDRRGCQGAPPDLLRRRHHRRGRQHRRWHDLRQLRRGGQAPHHRGRAQLRRLGLRADRAGEHRRRCLCRRRLGGDGGRRSGPDRRGARPAAQHRRLGGAPSRRHQDRAGRGGGHTAYP